MNEILEEKKKYYCSYCGVERDNLNAHTCSYCGKFLYSIEVIEDYHLEDYNDLIHQLDSFDEIYDKVMTKKIIHNIIRPLKQKKRKPNYIKIVFFAASLFISIVLIILLIDIPKTIAIDYSNLITFIATIIPIMIIIGIIYFTFKEGN